MNRISTKVKYTCSKNCISITNSDSLYKSSRVPTPPLAIVGILTLAFISCINSRSKPLLFFIHTGYQELSSSPDLHFFSPFQSVYTSSISSSMRYISQLSRKKLFSFSHQSQQQYIGSICLTCVRYQIWVFYCSCIYRNLVCA